MGFPALDGIPSGVKMATELQCLHADWTMHRTTMQVDWMSCLPVHQRDNADPIAVIAINKHSKLRQWVRSSFAKQKVRLNA